MGREDQIVTSINYPHIILLLRLSHSALRKYGAALEDRFESAEKDT